MIAYTRKQVAIDWKIPALFREWGFFHIINILRNNTPYISITDTLIPAVGGCRTGIGMQRRVLHY